MSNDSSVGNLEGLEQHLNDHTVDQFVETMASRGYQLKTSEEVDKCLALAVQLTEKVASGHLPESLEEGDSVLDQLNEKVAGVLGNDSHEVQYDRYLQGVQQKVASTAGDPYVLLGTLVRLQAQEQSGQ